MATYVTSDAHGHVRALDRALEMARPGTQDTVFVLGDMVDRGPDPLGVITLVRSLPNVHVLMGNHEAMLLETILKGNQLDMMSWHMNGGFVTSEQLDALPRERYAELMDWLAALPTFAVVETDDARPTAAPGARRMHVLCHAGIDAPRLRASLAQAGVGRMAGVATRTPRRRTCWGRWFPQQVEDLLWIRHEFWSNPTGLVGLDGRGPVVGRPHPVDPAGSLCAPHVRDGRGREPARRDGGGWSDARHGRVADRICIDCSAAAGYPSGRVGVMRLEDRRVWYADINEGE